MAFRQCVHEREHLDDLSVHNFSHTFGMCMVFLQCEHEREQLGYFRL